MKFTLNWLKEHLDTTASLQEVLDKLTMIGLEVEDVKNPGQDLKDFKIVEVLSVAPHPDADRLQVLKVNTGEETLQVVCGDLSVTAGMKGVLARPGMYVPGLDMTMKVAKVRGVESHGMMCSLQELQLAESSDGVIQLDKDAQVSQPFAADLDDPQIEIAITPNRGDCLGVRGIARDLAATGIGTLKPFPMEPVNGHFDSPYPLEIEDTTVCPLFVGRLVKGVKNRPSPAWLKQRLEAIGLRPISALVDITNLLAYELGRPMHVFDASKVDGKVVVRFAKEGEALSALDEAEYKLDASMIVVADQSKPLSIAGIMGGEDSGCTLETTDVYVESAIFDAQCIAQTGRKLNLLSDSRYRFERGVDAEQVIPAMERATQLILDICGGEASRLSVAGSVPQLDRTVSFRPARVKELGGIEIPSPRAVEILETLGFTVTGSGDQLSVQVPSWRHDVLGEADLVEEVLRIHGLDQIPVTPFPNTKQAEDGEHFTRKTTEKRTWVARKVLSERGLSEALTWSFMPEDQAKWFGWSDPDLELANPISTDLSIMRPSILPNLIQAAARNFDKLQESSSLFEIGAQYQDATPTGQLNMASGIRAEGEPRKSWTGSVRAPDIYDVKADALAVLEACGINPNSLKTLEVVPDYYHPGRSAALCLGPQTVLAYFGQLHPSVQKAYDLDKPVVMFEVFLSHIPLPKAPKKKGALKISPYQAVERDFAFVVDAKTHGETVLKAAERADKSLISAVTLFDIYQGEHMEAGKKSVAIGVKLQPYDRTLTEAEITAVSEKVIHEVQQATGGTLRT